MVWRKFRVVRGGRKIGGDRKLILADAIYLPPDYTYPYT
jgi:hypothetical protein